jgi:hypothetical protein
VIERLVETGRAAWIDESRVSDEGDPIMGRYRWEADAFETIGETNGSSFAS